MLPPYQSALILVGQRLITKLVICVALNKRISQKITVNQIHFHTFKAAVLNYLELLH